MLPLGRSGFGGRRRLEVRRHARAMLAATAGAFRAHARLSSRAGEGHWTRAAPRRARRPAAPTRRGRWCGRETGRHHSRLFVLGDTFGWALDDEAAYVSGVAGRAGYRLGPPGWARYARGQVVFHTSHFAALDPLWTRSSHRLGLAYFHGRPGTPGYPEFDRAFAALERDPARFDRVQVTHREMEEIVVSAGVAPASVHRIPIGIELDRFPLGDDGSVGGRRGGARASTGRVRRRLVPEGRCRLRGRPRAEVDQRPRRARGGARGGRDESSSDLVVLLTGPARGYVRREPSDAVPHVHRCSRRVTGSRRPTTRSMRTSSRRDRKAGRRASSSPWRRRSARHTRAGQAPDLVVDGENGILVDVEDAEGDRGRAVRIHRDTELATTLRGAGRRTATENSHERLAGAGRRCSTGSRSDPVDSERVARYGRAATRWGRLLVAGRAGPGLRVFYGWDRIPRPASRSRAAPRSCRSSPSAGPTTPRTSRSSTSARRTCRATCDRCSGSRESARADRRQPGRRRLPGLGGRPDRRAQRAAPSRGARGRPRRLPERVQQAFLGRVPRSAERIVGDPAERGRRRAFTPGHTAGRRPGRAARGRPDQAYRLEYGLETFRHVVDEHRPRASSSVGRLVSDPEPTLRRLALREAVDFSAGTRRPTHPTSSAARTFCSTRRSTIHARRW